MYSTKGDSLCTKINKINKKKGHCAHSIANDHCASLLGELIEK